MSTINGSVSNNSSKYKYWIDWYEDSVNIGANTSVVHANVYVQRIADYQSYNTNVPTTLTIDGQNFTANVTVDMNPNTNPVLLCSASKTIQHNNDGTRSINISASTSGMSGGGFGPNNGSASGTVGLTTIPRQANITSGCDYTLQTGNLNVSISNPGNLFIRSYWYVNGVLIKTNNLGQVGGISLSFADFEVQNMYAQMPNGLQISCEMLIQTFADSGYNTQVGGNSSVNGTIYVNQGASTPLFSRYYYANVDKSIPVVDQDGVTLVTSSTATLLGRSDAIIYGYSKVRATIYSGDRMVTRNQSSPNYYRYILGNNAVNTGYSTGDVNIDIDNVTDLSSSMTAFDSRNLATGVGPSNGFNIVSYYWPIQLYNLHFLRDSEIGAPTQLLFSGYFWKYYFGSNSQVNPGVGTQNSATFHYRWKSTTHNWFALDGNFTITIASPGVVTKNNHGFQTGDIVWFQTTGALPTGISTNTLYWVIYIDANTFKLATSSANATAGTAINTSGSQSGTHTLHGDSMWTTLSPTINSDGSWSFQGYVNGDLGAGGFSANKSFSIQVRGYDSLSVMTIEAVLNVGTPLMHWTQTAIGINKKVESANDSILQLAGSISLDTQTFTPSNPDQSSQGKMYIKGTKLIFMWNDGGTIRYKYLDLSGTGTSWVHTTSAP